MLTALTFSAILTMLSLSTFRRYDGDHRHPETFGPRDALTSESATHTHSRRGAGGGLGHQRRDHNRERGSADIEFGTGRVDARVAVDRRRLQSGIRRAGAGRGHRRR